MNVHVCETPGCNKSARCYGRSAGYVWTYRCDGGHCDHIGDGGIFDRGGPKCGPLCAKCGEDVCDCAEAR